MHVSKYLQITAEDASSKGYCSAQLYGGGGGGEAERLNIQNNVAYHRLSETDAFP